MKKVFFIEKGNMIPQVLDYDFDIKGVKVEGSNLILNCDLKEEGEMLYIPGTYKASVFENDDFSVPMIGVVYMLKEINDDKEIENCFEMIKDEVVTANNRVAKNIMKGVRDLYGPITFNEDELLIN